MAIAWNANTNSYNDWQIEKSLAGEDVLELRYNAQIDSRRLQIKINLPAQIANKLDYESTKKTVVDIAAQIKQLISAHARSDIINLAYDGSFAKIIGSNWANDDAICATHALPALKDRIRSFAAMELVNREDIDKIKAAYHESMVDPQLREDVDALLKVLLATAHRKNKQITAQTFKCCIDAFKRLGDPAKRKSILEIVEKLAEQHADWLPCIFMLLDADLATTWQPEHAYVDSWRPLLAGGRNYAELIDELTRRGIDPRIKDPRGDSLLMVAICEGHEEIAIKLIRERMFANINGTDTKRGSSVLEEACRDGQINVVMELLKIKEIDVNAGAVHPLQAAIRSQHPEVVEALLSTGAIEGLNDIQANRGTFLTTACSHTNVEIVKLLLACNEIDVNKESGGRRVAGEGRTPLHYAITGQHMDIALELLKKPDIDVNALSEKDKHPLIAFFESRVNETTFLEEILNHPAIDTAPLFNFLENNPKVILNPHIEILFTQFPETSQCWLNQHPEMQIARLISRGNAKAAQLELDKHWDAGQAFNIVRLLKISDSIASFLTETNRSSFITWLTDHNILDNLPISDQRLVLNEIYPRFYQYMDLKGTLAPKGIKLISDYLRKKENPSLPHKERITVCEDRETFAYRLRKLARAKSKQDEHSHHFIVTKSDDNQDKLAAHVTPLFMKKTAGAWDIIITDSTTDHSNCKSMQSSCAPLLANIDQVEKMLPQAFKVRKVYINTFWRQSDDSSCPVFAIRDSAYFYKHGDAFLEELSTVNKGSESKVIYFNDLPPELMKTTQSISGIQNYAAKRASRGQNLSMATNKPQKSETLLENLERHKQKAIDGSNRAWNALVSERALKYQKIVIAKVIEDLKASV